MRPVVHRVLLIVLLAGLGACHDRSNAERNDDYRFAAPPRTIALQEAHTGRKLIWPAGLQGWDTALLRVHVQADARAPRVTIEAGTTRYLQYLDEGANGQRWLNLTGLHGDLREGSVVTLSGEGVSIDGAEAALQVFDNRIPLNEPMLVLAPHPDDAEIAAFGLYADRNAHIVTVTAGNAGDALDDGLIADRSEKFRFKGFLRAIDSVTVPWQGGITPSKTYNLGYFDSRLKAMHGEPARVFTEANGPGTDVAPYRRANLSTLLPNESRDCSWNNLVDDLVSILNQVNPALIVMPIPQLDAHPDHQFTAVALAQALKRWSGKARFLLYTNHAPGTDERFPFGPAGTAGSLPPGDGGLPPLSVYAHPVGQELRLRKLFALESMHDLRPTPFEQSALVDGILNPTKRDSFPRQPEYDYLRRAIRPQELFFVADADTVQALIEEFLRPPGKQRI